MKIVYSDFIRATQVMDLDHAVRYSLTPSGYSYEGHIEKLEAQIEKLQELITRLVEIVVDPDDRTDAEKAEHILGHGYEVKE